MPAPLSLRIKEQYMAKRARGLSQQIAADAVGISVADAQPSLAGLITTSRHKRWIESFLAGTIEPSRMAS